MAFSVLGHAYLSSRAICKKSVEQLEELGLRDDRAHVQEEEHTFCWRSTCVDRARVVSEHLHMSPMAMVEHV